MAFCKYCGTQYPDEGNCPQCNPQAEAVESPAEPVVAEVQEEAPGGESKAFCKFCGAELPADGQCPCRDQSGAGNAFCRFCGSQFPVGGVCPNGCQQAAPAAAPTAFPPLRTKRSTLLFILLSVLTLGIYPIVVMHGLAKDINTIASPYDEDKTPSFIVMLLLSCVTLGIYALVWYHKLSKRIGNELQRRNIYYKFGAKDFWLWNTVGCLLLGLGPIIYTYNLFTAMQRLAENFNEVELGIAPARPAAPVQQRVPATVGAPAAPGAAQTQPAYVAQPGAPVAVAAQPAVPKTDAQENLVMGILSYLGLLFLVPLFGAKKSKFARFHTSQGFNLFLGEVGIVIVSILLNMFKATIIHIARTAGSTNIYRFTSSISPIFTIINAVLWLGAAAFAVIGIINAVQGKEVGLPVLGKAQLLQVSEEGEPDFKATGNTLWQYVKKVPKIAYIILAAIVGVLILTSITLSIVDSAKISSARKQAAAIAAQAEEEARKLREEEEEAMRSYTEPPTTEAPAAPEKTLDTATPTLAFTPAELTLLGSAAISDGYVGLVGGLENGFVFSYTSTQQGTAQMQAAVRAFEGRPYSIYVNDTFFREVEVPGTESFSIVPDVPVNFGKNTIKIVGSEAKYWAPDFATLTLTLNSEGDYIDLTEFKIRVPTNDSLVPYSVSWETDKYQVAYEYEGNPRHEKFGKLTNLKDTKLSLVPVGRPKTEGAKQYVTVKATVTRSGAVILSETITILVQRFGDATGGGPADLGPDAAWYTNILDRMKNTFSSGTFLGLDLERMFDLWFEGIDKTPTIPGSGSDGQEQDEKSKVTTPEDNATDDTKDSMTDLLRHLQTLHMMNRCIKRQNHVISW